MLYRKNATIKDLINSEKLKMITIKDITTDTVLHTGAVANIPMAILTIPFIYDTLVSHRNKDAQVYVRINQPRRTTNYYKKRYR